ncbi:uncharacterized protein LOC131629234 [Vicia villosa]|uniref:uncharacterized protein LOC131629234 n=1 Tax=Vicia villosa TaxID=3911 RepID=UPI00273C4A68|nr:uncharacterized protein LOC131629234 [Vicia villosa]
MICWNVRGLNKHARCLEVGAHLKKLQVSCLALLETRVKINNSKIVRKRLGFDWEFIDNYEHHINGRIWLAWNPNIWSITPIEKTEQLVHSDVYTNTGNLSHHLIIVYAQNQINNRRSLWQDLGRIRSWFTWSNKQIANPISSRIDRALVNADWYRGFPNSSVEVLNPHIYDHDPLTIKMYSHQTIKKIKHRFKFLNCIAGHADYLHVLRANWNQHNLGNPMEQFWKNLYKLQYSVKGLTWQMTEGIRNLKTLCQNVKFWTDEVLKNTELEENILQQKLKCDWITLGDGNNAYFYANLKSKNKQIQIKELEDAQGNRLTEQKDIELEQEGAQLNREQQESLIVPVTEAEIWQAINSMGDNKAPGCTEQ